MTFEERAKARENVARLEGELAAAKELLYHSKDDPLERKTLLRLSWRLWFFFLLFVLGAAAWAAWVIQQWPRLQLADYSLSAAVGVLGAALSGWMSLNQRVANGLEFEDGSREPDPGKRKERFNGRLAGGFFARPLLGLVSGPLVLAGIKVGRFVQETVSPEVDEQYRIVFFCVLGGLFAKTLFDWLKEVFKHAVGQ